MAWNRTNTTTINEQSQPRKRTNTIVLSLLSAIFIALALICYFISGDETTTESSGVHSKKIKTITPSIEKKPNELPEARTNQPVRVLRDHPELSLEELKKLPHWCYGVEDRKRIDPTYAQRHENFLKAQAAIPWATNVDRCLAMLMFAKDGNTGLLIPFDKRFAERFVESLKTPTLVLSTDSEELQEQKRQLNEVKAYLNEELAKGTDISELLNDEMKRVKKIGSLRSTLEREIREFAKTATSWEEVDDMIAAANVMLKDSGASEMKLPFDLKIKRLHQENYKESKTHEN